MARYKAKKIVTEEIDGYPREVKYLESYTKESFQAWVKILNEEDYQIYNFSRTVVTFKHKYSLRDFVKLTCKAPIRVAWVRLYYPDFFKTIFSPEYIKENADKIEEMMDNATKNLEETDNGD